MMTQATSTRAALVAFHNECVDRHNAAPLCIQATELRIAGRLAWVALHHRGDEAGVLARMLDSARENIGTDEPTLTIRGQDGDTGEDLAEVHPLSTTLIELLADGVSRCQRAGAAS